LKTCLSFLAATCAIPCLIWAQSRPVPDFRRTAWGMTRAQVLAAEEHPPSGVRETNGEAVVEYQPVQVAGLEGRLVYFFVKGKLVRARYLFEAEPSDLNDFITDFRKLEPLLREQYGAPARDHAIWTDDSTQLEPKSYLDQDRATTASILPSDQAVGLAVSLGHLKLFTEWVSARTRIRHTLTGEDSRITHQVEYRSTASASLEHQVRQQDAKAVQ